MLSLQIQNPMVENYLYDHFKDDTKQMSLFINDFIEKELIKKDISTAFDEFDRVVTKREKGKPLQDFIKEITPK